MFDLSCVHPFRIAEDPGQLYVMIDAALVAEAAKGLSAPQKAALNALRWTPTPEQAPFIPQWAGNDPPAVYFKAGDSAIKAALKKRYQAPAANEADDDIAVVSTTLQAPAPL